MLYSYSLIPLFVYFTYYNLVFYYKLSTLKNLFSVLTAEFFIKFYSELSSNLK